MPLINKFKLPGAFIEVDGNIVAMSVGEVVNDTLYCHIEKANRDYHGAYQMIVREFASHILEEYPDVKYINREEDVGDEGLRKQNSPIIQLTYWINIVFLVPYTLD